jgi:hypothetical protein
MASEVILLCADASRWTHEALHLASALSLDTGWLIHLVELVPVDGPTLLGQPAGYRHYGVRDCLDSQTYTQILDDYGVEYCFDLFQYVTRQDAIVDVAEQLDAQVVFATLPHSRFALWRRLGLWNLRRRLNHAHRRLYTLENALDALVWSPSRRETPTDAAEHAHPPW